MRFRKLAALLIIFLLCGCEGDSVERGPYTEATPTECGWEYSLEKRCDEIAEWCGNLIKQSDQGDRTISQSQVDAVEQRLMEYGIAVMDTHSIYPSHLTADESFYHFWRQVQSGESTQQEAFTVLPSGELSCRLFVFNGETAWLYSMRYDLLAGSMIYYTEREILDWTLTQRGNFYYRTLPAGDKHYPDYSLIRISQVQPELYDMYLRYIAPGGYIGTNIFLSDWSEGDWRELSFNDVFEYFFYAANRVQFQPEPDMYDAQKRYCYIPASLFEETVLPYFDIDLDTFRGLAAYQVAGDKYPWRGVGTNDFTFLWYYHCSPEVTACRRNLDETLTLTVEVLSTDLKLDCLFAHEVTVRPLEEGSFQYVSNRVIFQTEHGLPYCKPRLTWD